MNLTFTPGATAAKKIADRKCRQAVFEAHRSMFQHLCEQAYAVMKRGGNTLDIDVVLSPEEDAVVDLLGMRRLSGNIDLTWKVHHPEERVVATLPTY